MNISAASRSLNQGHVVVAVVQNLLHLPGLPSPHNSRPDKNHMTSRRRTHHCRSTGASHACISMQHL